MIASEGLPTTSELAAKGKQLVETAEEISSTSREKNRLD